MNNLISTQNQRPCNAYSLYCLNSRKLFELNNPDIKPREITLLITKGWTSMSDTQKIVYRKLAYKRSISYYEELHWVLQKPIYSENVKYINTERYPGYYEWLQNEKENFSNFKNLNRCFDDNVFYKIKSFVY